MKLKTPTHKHSPAAAGFTLTELLVVILIIVTLAALGFAGIRTVRQSAQAAGCVENLRTWGIAIRGYAADNNGSVQWSNWASIGSADRYYETYLGGNGVSATATMDGKAVFATQFHRRCPSQKWNGTGNGPVGYAMVRPNPKVPSVGFYNLNTASDPAQLLLMMDVSTGLNLNGPTDIPAATAALFSGETQRHRKSFNALFGDGHVSTYQSGDLKKQEMLNRWFTLR